jgi:hypothetical protein
VAETIVLVLQVLGPRRRKQVDYREANMGARAASSSDFSGGDEEDEDKAASGSKGTKRAAEGEVQQATTSKKAKKKVCAASLQCWEASTCLAICQTRRSSCKPVFLESVG